MPGRPTAFLTPPALPRLLRRPARGRSPRTQAPTRPRCTATTPDNATTSLAAAAASVRTGTRTATDLLDDALTRMERTEPTIRAFLTVDVARAHARATEVDARVRRGESVGVLAGVPIAVKDNLCTEGLATTAASRILDGFVPAYSATAVRRLEAAGAVVLGKTNMDEFGMGSSTEGSAYAVTTNPHDVTCVPGGSSGGSAAAVASGQCVAALGTDTGGSVRQPASFCGLTGLRPSYGRVSRHGLLAYASSLDTVGPLCHSVRDAALLLQTIAGVDPMDSTTVKAPVPNYSNLLNDNADLSGVTIGVIEDAMTDAVHPDVTAAVSAATEKLRKLGATIRPVALPRLSAATAAYYVLALSEASANLARYDGVRYGMRDPTAINSNDMYARSRAKGLGAEVKRRIMAGTFALSSGYYDAYYLRAQRVRGLVTRDLKDAFASGIHALVSPVAPTPAFHIGEKMHDPVSMYLDDLMTIPASLAGLPAISVPCGRSGNLPIGMQIMGPFLDEARIFEIGHAFQIATEHHGHVANVLEHSMTAAA